MAKHATRVWSLLDHTVGTGSFRCWAGGGLFRRERGRVSVTAVSWEPQRLRLEHRSSGCVLSFRELGQGTVARRLAIGTLNLSHLGRKVPCLPFSLTVLHMHVGSARRRSHENVDGRG